MRASAARRYRRRLRRMMRGRRLERFGVFDSPAGRVTYHKIPRKK